MSGLSRYRRVLSVGQRQSITVRGTTVFLRQATGEIEVTTRTMQILDGMGDHYTVPMEASEKVFTSSEFDSVVIENTSGVENTIELLIGYGDFFRPVPDIIQVEFDAPQDVNIVSSQPSPAPSTVIDSKADVLVEGAAVQILAANGTRVRALVTAPIGNANTLRVGDNGVGAANGTPLAPGETLPLDTTAAIFAIGVAASGDVLAVTELNL